MVDSAISDYMRKLGKKGGAARAKALTARQRRRIAKKARAAQLDGKSRASDSRRKLPNAQSDASFTADDQRRIAEARRNGRAGVVKVKR